MKIRRGSVSSFLHALPFYTTIFLLAIPLSLFASPDQVYGPPAPVERQKTSDSNESHSTHPSPNQQSGESENKNKTTQSESFEKRRNQFGSKPLFQNAESISDKKTEKGKRNFKTRDYTPDFLSLALWTLVIIGGIILIFFLIKKYMPATRRLFSQPGIEVLSQLPLNKSGSIYLLQVGERILRVGATNENITYMGEIDDPEEVARLKSQCDGNNQPSQNFSDTFDSLKNREPHDNRKGDAPEDTPFSSPFGKLNDELTNLHSIIDSWKNSS